nr:hypothetical protein [Tanacetum cinerariifolium]
MEDQPLPTHAPDPIFRCGPIWGCYTLTASRVIEMDDPTAVTDSSGVPSTIERSPLDFSFEAVASDQGTVAPEMPPSEDVPATDVPGAGQAEEIAATDPLAAPESRKRGRDGSDVNAPPKSLRRDHADPRPSGSSHGGKVLLPYNWVCRLPFLCLKTLLQASVTRIRCSSLTHHHAIPQMLPSKSSQGTAMAGDSESENVSSPVEVGSPESIYRSEWGVVNGSLLDTPEACQDLVDHVAPPGYFSELRHLHDDEFLRRYNVNLARQETMTTVNQGMSVEEIKRVVAQRVANAIEAIAIYETKTNLAHKSMSQTEQQEEEVAEITSNKRKWESNHNGSLSQQNKGNK